VYLPVSKKRCSGDHFLRGALRQKGEGKSVHPARDFVAADLRAEREGFLLTDVTSGNLAGEKEGGGGNKVRSFGHPRSTSWAESSCRGGSGYKAIAAEEGGRKRILVLTWAHHMLEKKEYY